ncbi:MAG: archaeosortase/exosortase family protein [Pseudomonadales bacterium]
MLYALRAHLPTAWLIQVLALTAVFAAVVLVEVYPAVSAWLAPLNVAIAGLTAALIDWLGMAVAWEASVLYHPTGFGYEIGAACTGLVPALVVIATLCCLPLRANQRLLAIGLGVLFTQGINLVRLVVLYYIGVHYPSSFDLAHDWLGQGLIIVTTALFIIFWIRTSGRAMRQSL